jgi:hypothetical protein
MARIALTRDRESLGQGILIDGAILHDDEEILAGVSVGRPQFGKPLEIRQLQIALPLPR